MLRVKSKSCINLFLHRRNYIAQTSASHHYIAVQYFNLIMCVNLHNPMKMWQNHLKWGMSTWCSDTSHYKGNQHCISQILPPIMRVYISLNVGTAFRSTSSMLVNDKKILPHSAIQFSVKWSLMQVLTHGHSFKFHSTDSYFSLFK